jgi:hypothetical protein
MICQSPSRHFDIRNKLREKEVLQHLAGPFRFPAQLLISPETRQLIQLMQ